MAKPLPLPVWDRRAGKLVMEFMDGHRLTYESEPSRSIGQWIKSQAVRLALCRVRKHALERARDRAIYSQVSHRHERVRADPISLVRRIFRPTIPAWGPQAP